MGRTKIPVEVERISRVGGIVVLRSSFITSIVGDLLGFTLNKCHIPEKIRPEVGIKKNNLLEIKIFTLRCTFITNKYNTRENVTVIRRLLNLVAYLRSRNQAAAEHHALMQFFSHSRV